MAPALHEGFPAQPWVSPPIYAEHKPLALRSPPPTNSQSCWRATRMCARMRADTHCGLCAMLLAVPALPGLPQVGWCAWPAGGPFQ